MRGKSGRYRPIFPSFGGFSCGEIEEKLKLAVDNSIVAYLFRVFPLSFEYSLNSLNAGGLFYYIWLWDDDYRS